MWRNTFAGGAPAGVQLEVTGAATGSISLPFTDRDTVAAVPDGTYTVRVRAVNAAGVSSPSNSLTFTFPGTCTISATPALTVTIP